MIHHPDIELLLKYANGQLPSSISIAIGIHQHECDLCKARVQDIESIGGDTMAMAENVSEQPSFNSKNKLSSSFDKLFSEVGQLEQFSEKEEFDECVVPQVDLPVLAKLSKRDFSDIRWKRVTTKLMKANIEFSKDDYQIELLRFSPHAKIPMHTHEGEEITVVLEGEFSDSQGVYRKGEFIVQDQTHTHKPKAGRSGCICLAVTTAPLRFTGTLGPILNWITR